VKAEGNETAILALLLLTFNIEHHGNGTWTESHYILEMFERATKGTQATNGLSMFSRLGDVMIFGAGFDK